MEEIKQGWRRRISWLLVAIIVVVVYKMLDNFSNVQAWFSTFFTILKPFLIGVLISYILFIPCTKIENILKQYEESKQHDEIIEVRENCYEYRNEKIRRKES